MFFSSFVRFSYWKCKYLSWRARVWGDWKLETEWNSWNWPLQRFLYAKLKWANASFVKISIIKLNHVFILRSHCVWCLPKESSYVSRKLGLPKPLRLFEWGYSRHLATISHWNYRRLRIYLLCDGDVYDFYKWYFPRVCSLRLVGFAGDK